MNCWAIIRTLCLCRLRRCNYLTNLFALHGVNELRQAMLVKLQCRSHGHELKAHLDEGGGLAGRGVDSALAGQVGLQQG